MTKFGDKTLLHVHVQVTSSFSQPLYYIGECVQRYILYRDLKLLLNIDICPRYDCRSGRQVNRGKKSIFLSAAESVLKVRILAKIYC